MRFTTLVKNGFNALISPLGYTVINAHYSKSNSMRGAISAIKNRKHQLQTVVDIGASNGQWSLLFMESFPAAQYLLIEAQPIHEKELRSFCRKHSNAQYLLAAAGETDGEINFDASGPFGGQASPDPYPANNIVVPMSTVDNQVLQRNLKGPFLLKLDTHGYELPILKGAARTMKQSEVIIIECYNHKLTADCLLFYEICQYMEEHGFRCIDLVDVMHRPHDGSLWQMDLVFIPAGRAEFQYQSYE